MHNLQVIPLSYPCVPMYTCNLVHQYAITPLHAYPYVKYYCDTIVAFLNYHSKLLDLVNSRETFCCRASSSFMRKEIPRAISHCAVERNQSNINGDYNDFQTLVLHMKRIMFLRRTYLVRILTHFKSMVLIKTTRPEYRPIIH